MMHTDNIVFGYTHSRDFYPLFLILLIFQENYYRILMSLCRKTHVTRNLTIILWCIIKSNETKLFDIGIFCIFKKGSFFQKLLKIFTNLTRKMDENLEKSIEKKKGAIFKFRG